jgi:hypothetical protein
MAEGGARRKTVSILVGQDHDGFVRLSTRRHGCVSCAEIGLYLKVHAADVSVSHQDIVTG